MRNRTRNDKYRFYPQTIAEILAMARAHKEIKKITKKPWPLFFYHQYYKRLKGVVVVVGVVGVCVGVYHKQYVCIHFCHSAILPFFLPFGHSRHSRHSTIPSAIRFRHSVCCSAIPAIIFVAAFGGVTSTV
jgi:hypothetical protein